MGKNEVMNTEKHELVIPTDANAWGDVAMEAKDFIRPKILLQQAMSESVKSRVANDGDYLNTLSNSVCSDDKGDVKILPFYCHQYYVIDKWNGSKFVFDKVDPYIPGVKREFEELVEGVRYKVTHTYSFSCLLEEGGIPVLVPFKSTSNYEGKRLFNLMYPVKVDGKPSKIPAENWIKLGRKQTVSKGGDKYFQMTIEKDRASTPEELKECLFWIPIVKVAKVADMEDAPAPEKTTTETRF